MTKEYLHLFETNSDFQEAYNGSDYHEPWVSLINENNNVNYNKSEREKLLGTPLTFVIQSDGLVYWRKNTTELTIEYKLNDGEWTEITATSFENPSSISVVSGDTIQFRGDNVTYGYDSSSSCNELSSFYGSTCGFSVKGNIMSLIDSTNFSTITEFTMQNNDAFAKLFQYCRGLTDASELILPSTTAVFNCYNGMFEYCSGLTQAPALPATTLDTQCYQGMFRNCTSLTQAPELPAETISYYSYAGMFNGCSSLNYIKCLATDTSASSCTWDWVNGVAASGTFVAAKDVIWYYGPDGIPQGWTMVNGIAQEPLI